MNRKHLFAVLSPIILFFAHSVNTTGTYKESFYTIDDWDKFSDHPKTEKQANLFKTVKLNSLVPATDDTLQNDESNINHQTKLYADIFIDGGEHDYSKYNPELLPIPENQKFVDVEMQNYIVKLMNFDIEAQTLDTAFGKFRIIV